ncbi:aminobenzoyl-glutamate transport protein [Saccharopolyspora antimicrobica]|uniref:Aminobenzoyl-glutamate transport protein n=1 Tax=Saccharopolyspora antimicrobica TaxID=455193 RepID=A0A1I5FFM1_9PSEU|nr:AbgT family transporter [Saccharopolyspora antimicrobica]RKT82122.1 aminobenzoyl-glutamate transport protein [Saccharopolyspora antimicrobica]SFO22534.1 aminobenzoyl-glutamate transport protein [Saccharopolyspora antimicrobica]
MSETRAGRPPRLDRVLNLVERVGNKLPEPFILFGLLFLAVVVISTAVAAFGVTVRIPGDDEVTPIRGALTGEGLEFLFTKMAENFIGFPPLETVVTIMLAVGLAERTGLLTALIRVAFGGAPRWVLPYAVGLVGIAASVMADSSMIIIPPLAALVFKAAGRHPVAGLLGGFAAVGAGYSTSPLVTSLDALFAGISNKVAETLPDPGTVVTPVSNYYFNLASSIVLGLLAGLLIDKVIEPRLVRTGVPREESEAAPSVKAELEPAERRGLIRAGVAFLLTAAGVLLLVVWPDSPLRNEAGGFLPKSPLLDSVTTLIFLGFVVPAIVYGARVGVVRRAADVPKLMAEAIRELAGFLVLAFMLGQFIALFNWTNLGAWVAVSGAELLRAIGLDGYPAFLGFMVLASVLNLFIISGSSLWTLMASVFVPMFVLLGFEPGFAQAAFRVGDSATQIMTPLNPYMIIILGYLRRYEPEAGMGTLVARMTPFVIPFWLVWALILTVFYFADLPLGPGTGIRITP